MMVLLSTIVNSKDGIYVTAARTIGGIKFLKDGYSMVMVDGRRQCRFIELLKYADGVG